MAPTFYNTYLGFLYRQFFICPSKPPPSLSLQGQTGLVTGANTGLGYHASLQLLIAGLSRLILAVRNVAKGEAAREALLASLAASNSNKPSPAVEVEVWELNLTSSDGIIAFVKRLKSSDICVDLAILNAGVANFECRCIAPTGHEESIQINWLSTALLTLLLIPILDLQYQQKQEREKSQAPQRPVITILLYQLFFLVFMQTHRHNRADSSKKVSHGSGAVLNLVNPGFCYGPELHLGAEGALGKGLGSIKRAIGRSVSVGARTLVYAAVVVGSESDGCYLSDNRIAPDTGFGRSEKGREIQRIVWEETVNELAKVVDVRRTLGET